MPKQYKDLTTRFCVRCWNDYTQEYLWRIPL